MAKHFGVGDKVIAKSTHIECGFRKGDVILIKKKAYIEGDFIGENLTYPNCYGNERVYVSDSFNGKLLHDRNITRRVYFLGIPIFTVKEVKGRLIIND